MKTILAITAATIYGLSIRLFFGFLDQFMGIMSLSFLVIVPVLIGFLTVRLIPRHRIKSSGAAFGYPVLTCVVILVITIASGIEGDICWMMMFPFFAILAGLGGLLAYKWRKKDDLDDDYEIGDENSDKLKISLVLLVIPVLGGTLENDRSLSNEEIIVSRHIVVKANAAEVWKSIVAPRLDNPEKHATRLSSFLGFPKHIYTSLDTAAAGGKRTAVYEKGLIFDEVISRYEENKALTLDIKTDAGKIPADVMDEHIVIGGKHLDILEDVYKLESIPGAGTRVTLSSRFVINTPFNWYAAMWAKYIIADLLEGELDLIKLRSQK
ncbi:SRPBCC family protein [Foetidibacter luteolus]|uniref:SRPBCC family protein n=1 Tax=Foetidibacter luteolus TaxID=2608880 RepID=UPI00129A9A3A|nr:SRPBCC family protein [Foetidibacter luteolus]